MTQYLAQLPYDDHGLAVALPIGAAVWDAIDYGYVRRAALRFAYDTDATRSRKRAADAAEDLAHSAYVELGTLYARACSWAPFYGPVRADKHGAPLQTIGGAYARAYVPKDSESDDDMRTVTFGTLVRWAIKHQARAYGFSAQDERPDEGDSSAQAAEHRMAQRIEYVRPEQSTAASPVARAIWDTAYAPDAYPLLAGLLFHAADTGRTNEAVANLVRATYPDSTGRARARRASVEAAAAAQWSALADHLGTLREAVGQQSAH